MSSLQMLTYITVRGFYKRSNKKQEEYGWPVASYSLSEKLFGEKHVRSAYQLSAQEAREKIVTHIMSKFPQASKQEIEKVIK